MSDRLVATSGTAVPAYRFAHAGYVLLRRSHVSRTFSDVTAAKQYGVSQEFIVKGIEAGQLEFRDGSMWGNPYLRIPRSQLESYIVSQLGSGYLANQKLDTQVRAVKKEIGSLRKKLAALEARKTALEDGINDDNGRR